MLRVVCAFIKKNGKYLITKRPLHKSEALKWEFPGGKIEEEEREEDAITREIREELSISIKPLKRLAHAQVNQHGKEFVLIGWLCEWVDGDIVLTEHIDSRWVTFSELEQFELSAADISLIGQVSPSMLE